MNKDTSNKRYKPFMTENHLRTFRKAKNLRQLDVSILLDFVTPDRISKWEKGKGFPSIINLLRIAAIYEAYPHELYSELFKHITREVIIKRTTSHGE